MQLPLRRHRGVRLRRRQRRLLVPRGQHAAAGGARRHRGGRAASTWWNGWCASPPANRRTSPAFRYAPRGHADAGAALCRGCGARLPALQRPADRSGAARTSCASMAGSRPAPRSATGTTRCWPRSSRTAPTRADGDRAAARGACRARASMASRPTCRSCSAFSAIAGVPGRPADHAAARQLRASATPGIEVLEPRHADHRAGLARAPGLLGRGRAALRTDG